MGLTNNPKSELCCRMTLLEFMRREGIDDAEMARRVGDCSAGAIRKWKYGERVPRPKFMNRIREVSGGQISPADFYDTSRLREAAP